MKFHLIQIILMLRYYEAAQHSSSAQQMQTIINWTTGIKSPLMTAPTVLNINQQINRKVSLSDEIAIEYVFRENSHNFSW